MTEKKEKERAKCEGGGRWICEALANLAGEHQIAEVEIGSCKP